MADEAARAGDGILETFRWKLANEWKRKAACGRHYVHKDQLLEWMRAEASGGLCNATHLFTKIFRRLRKPSAERLFQQGSSLILDKEKCSLVVFAILLDLGCGRLILAFWRAQIFDHHLHTYEHYIDSRWLELDKEGVKDKDKKKIIKDFGERMWLFTPARISLDMDEVWHGGKWIVPFCKRERINTKGGTADLWQVLIQEDLLPENIKKAIPQSRLKDRQYGWCYQMALKSFGSKNARIYGEETFAFSGLKRRNGLVQYLGKYEFEEPPNNVNRQSEKTYNILLEFGQLDLDEYFASELRYPPVLTMEIISFWTSLFKVAEALRDIHNLDFQNEDGVKQRVHGWHADLKPDNILFVHNEYKLADFGFAKFKIRSGRKPMTRITGGTQTYGAPECDSQHHQGKTSIQVSQTIDTWSFGTVLSIAATWVVLGFQGILAYDKLRKNAIAELKSRSAAGEDISIPSADDAFHDGSRVLPAVGEWHDYLRNVMRKSDTVTGKVLQLVDNNMLLYSPDKRLTSDLLCQHLETILRTAHDDFDSLQSSGSLTEISDTISKALLDADETAPSNEEEIAAAKEKSNNARKLDEISSAMLREGNDLPNQGPRTTKSKKIGKIARLESVQLGRVAHRAEVLGNQLNKNSTVTADRGAYWVWSSSSTDPSINQFPERCESPVNLSSATEGLVDRRGVLASDNQFSVLRDHQDYQRASDDLPPTGARQRPSGEVTYGVAADRSSWDIPNESVSPGNQQPPTSNAAYDSNLTQTTAPASHRNLGSMPPIKTRVSGFSNSESNTPVMVGSGGTRRDDSLISSHASTSTPYTPAPIFSNAALASYSQSYQQLDICKVRDELEHKSKLERLWAGADEYLRRFINDRDIKFVIDDGYTMSRHWAEAKLTLVTLAMKIKGLDKDGLDLVFAFEKNCNKSGVWFNTKHTFEKAMDKAAQKAHWEDYTTDMGQVLGDIFDEYLKGSGKKMTLVILTDGIWGGQEDAESVERKIAEFIKELRRLHGTMQDRPFSIQFITFGNDATGLSRLQDFDDNLSAKFGIPDVIDTEPWTGTVRKMILGSVRSDMDHRESMIVSPSSPLLVSERSQNRPASTAAPPSATPSVHRTSAQSSMSAHSGRPMQQ